MIDVGDLNWRMETAREVVHKGVRYAVIVRRWYTRSKYTGDILYGQNHECPCVDADTPGQAYDACVLWIGENSKRGKGK